MKFLKHLFPGKQNQSSTSSQAVSAKPNPKSFGEKRAQQMESSLQKAIKERKDLVRKEFASPDPLNKVYQQKGHRLDARIRDFKK